MGNAKNNRFYREPADQEEKIRKITADIGVRFRTFGGGIANENPMSQALKDQPLQFAACVNVADVVRFVLSRQ